MNLSIIIGATFSLTLLLIADYFRKDKLAAFFKAVTSILLLAYCTDLYLLTLDMDRYLLQFSQHSLELDYKSYPANYAVLILSAIVFGIIGDLFLIGKSKKLFLAGMAAFSIGHVFYILAFTTFEVNIFEWGAAAIGLSIALYSVYCWIASSLQGLLKYGVIAYMIVIGLMCSFGLTARVDGSQTLITLGAILFTLSDFFVAAHRFKKPRFSNRLIGLPLYYLGQFILASTIIHLSTDSFWLPV